MKGLRHGQTAEDIGNGRTRVSGRCRVTKKEYSIEVMTAELQAWIDGVLVQRAMPLVRKEDREFLISGMSPEGWNQIFQQEDDGN